MNYDDDGNGEMREPKMSLKKDTAAHAGRKTAKHDVEEAKTRPRDEGRKIW